MTQHITQEVAETIRESCYGQSNLSEFYRAMMNAAIQWDRDQRAKDLPELPDPYGIGAYPYPDTFTRAQTFTYGQQRAAQARKLALGEAEKRMLTKAAELGIYNHHATKALVKALGGK